LAAVGQNLWNESELFRLRQVMEQLYQRINAYRGWCAKHDFNSDSQCRYWLSPYTWWTL